MNQTHPTPEQLVDYLHGELPPPQDAAVHAHLAECSPCARAYEAESVAHANVLRAHARTQERELPYRVVAAIRDARRTTRQRPRRGNSLRALSAPSSCSRPRRRSPSRCISESSGTPCAGATPIDAAYYVNNHAALTATTPFSEDAPIPAMLTSDDQTQ